MSILWYSVAPTPQFVEVLNRLSAESDPSIFHHRSDDRGRGWGSLPIQYDYTLTPRGLLATARMIVTLVFARGAARGVFLGYSSTFAMLGLIAFRVTRRPVFFLADSSMIVERDRSLVARFAKRVLLRTLLSRRTKIWVVSEASSKYWQYYGFKNLVKIPFSSPMPPASADAFEKTLSHVGKTVLFVGRIVPEKGIDDLISAFQTLRDARGDLRLVIAGPRASSSPTWHSAPSAHFIGPVSRQHLSDWFCEADVLAVPSRVEPYGLVVREALQFGLPVVASDSVPAALDLCNRGWNIYPRGDINALVAALDHALAGPRWEHLKEPDLGATILRELGLSDEDNRSESQIDESRGRRARGSL